MIKKIIWYTVGIIFVLGLSFFAYGFKNAISIGNAINKEPNNIATTEEEKIDAFEADSVLVIGDSLARGTGDLTGKGFAGYVVEGLEKEKGADIPYYNIAIEGLKTQMLLSQVKEPKMAEGIRHAGIILISIGGNDLRAMAKTQSEERLSSFNESMRIFLDQLDQILRVIRLENEKAMIVFLGLYNLDYSATNAINSEYLLEWNHATQKLIESYEFTVFTPTYDLFKLNLEDYISPDGLHPNTKGHAAIGERILINLTSLSYF